MIVVVNADLCELVSAPKQLLLFYNVIIVVNQYKDELEHFDQLVFFKKVNFECLFSPACNFFYNSLCSQL